MPESRSKRRARPAKPVKSKSPGADHSGEALLDGIELKELRRLIGLVQRTGIGELEVRSGQKTVRISASHGRAVATMSVDAGGSPPALVRAPAEAPAAAHAPSPSDAYVAVTSPMVGTFYRAPAPDADPYVEVGDRIEVGQTVCIIEAMKLMNEIEAEMSGRVVQVLVENAQPVEFGQKLFLVEPS